MEQQYMLQTKMNGATNQEDSGIELQPMFGANINEWWNRAANPVMVK